MAASAALPTLTWDDTGKVLDVGGDINLDDGGSFQTTLQLVTPTAARTITFPDATGTVGLVAGSTGQLVFNNAGAYSGLSGVTTDGTDITLTGRFISSLNGAASAPPGTFTGTWFTGGTATTTKPQVLIEPTGTTSTAWSTSGTGLGVNAASGFAGNLLDLQVNGTSRYGFGSDGRFAISAPDATTFTGFTSSQSLSRGYGFYDGAPVIKSNFRGVSIGTDTLPLWIGTTTTNTNRDTGLFRDAAGTLAQRNDANAQTFRCYGTYTDASNYVRAALSSSGTAVTLAAETAGTGADDIPLNLTAAGTGTVKVNSVAEGGCLQHCSPGLPAAPAVGMLTRVTDADCPCRGLNRRRWWRCRCPCLVQRRQLDCYRSLILMATFSNHNRLTRWPPASSPPPPSKGKTPEEVVNEYAAALATKTCQDLKVGPVLHRPHPAPVQR
jgi:hypothetical protein